MRVCIKNLLDQINMPPERKRLVAGGLRLNACRTYQEVAGYWTAWDRFTWEQFKTVVYAALWTCEGCTFKDFGPTSKLTVLDKYIDDQDLSYLQLDIHGHCNFWIPRSKLRADMTLSDLWKALGKE